MYCVFRFGSEYYKTWFQKIGQMINTNFDLSTIILPQGIHPGIMQDLTRALSIANFRKFCKDQNNKNENVESVFVLNDEQKKNICVC